MWGVIAIALFADDRGTGLASKGGFYGGGGTLLGNNLILIISIIVWVSQGLGNSTRAYECRTRAHEHHSHEALLEVFRP